MKEAKKKNWKVLLVSLIAVYLTAFLGSIFTSNNTNTAWFQSIKPAITPAGWVFTVVWNVIFLLLALSLYYAWMSAKNKSAKKQILLIFGSNLILNVLWSFLFFSQKLPMVAFYELIALEISIVAMIALVWKRSRKSALLLLPYLLWIVFAAVLNYLSAFR
jgi:tryptophan-rich sensory protein